MAAEFHQNGFKMTELGPLPEEWDVVRLGDVANLIMGQSPPGSTYNKKGDGVPFLQGKAEFGEIHPHHNKYTTAPKKIAPKGSILMSVRAPVGDVNIADMDYCIGRGLSSISLINGDNKFLFFTLTLLKSSIEKEGTGSTFKAINKSKLESFKIPLPPLPEQKKIAAVLSAVQEAKEKTEEVIKATKELKKSLMEYLFTYGPVPVEEAEKIKLKKTEIGMVPEEWEVVRLGEVIEIYDKKRIPLSSSERGKMKGIYPYCGANGIIDYVNDYIFDGEFVLLAEDGGFWKKFENSAYLMKGKFWVNNHAHIIRAIENKTINRLLLYWFNYDDIEKYTSGTTRKKLNQSIMKNVKIPLPPLSIQQKIASILSAVDEKIQAEERKKTALENLFKTLLHNLMTAKIRVNHQPKTIDV